MQLSSCCSILFRVFSLTNDYHTVDNTRPICPPRALTVADPVVLTDHKLDFGKKIYVYNLRVVLKQGRCTSVATMINA